MLRGQKIPTGPGPADFASSRADENYNPMGGISRARRNPDNEEKLTASSRNNHSLFSFELQPNTEERKSPTGSFDFLPSVSFDDLHSSITTASNDFKETDYSTPIGLMSLGTGDGKDMSGTQGNDGRTGLTGRPAPLPRAGRSGSVLRRQSTSTRQSSMSSTNSTSSSTIDPTSTALPTRTRRQSHYPPVSGSNAGGKGLRKSIGPGGMDTELTAKASQRRRPSLATSVSTNSVGDAGYAGRSSLGTSGNAATEGARLASARAAKTKSLQPPSKQGGSFLATPTMTPEHTRSSSFAGRSPGRANGRGTTTPSSSAKRMSIMPGMTPSSSHATGLGARTVSPTDARRMKRMSMMQGSNIDAPPMPNTPPAASVDPAPVQRTSNSPSMLPRKSTTPSSLRTTPDINRKSYSSGISTGSNGSFNTARTSTGSLQQRLPQSASTSRLPTPKPRNVHSSAGNDDEEWVPPVPAIPKVYESPKDSPAEQPFFKQRKSSLPFDASSINSTSTNDLSGHSSRRDPVKHDPEYVSRGATTDAEQKASAPAAKKKNLQPLRLPPLNLLPLSTPTAAKIAALSQDSTPVSGQTTPPPRRITTKTPSTPMTASKASFFSSLDPRDGKPDFNLSHMRSTSSINPAALDSTSTSSVTGASQNITIPAGARQTRQAVSPYMSSSLPKASAEYSFMPRSKTSGDSSAVESASEHRAPRLTGPRAQKNTKTVTNDTPPQHSSPEESTTPSSTATTSSSLRRKLSLGWKRNTSKSSIGNISHAANERDSEYPPPPPKHDNMPPPRLPASATLNNLSTYTSVPSPSPSIKSTNYLDSKRRKSSISSLTMFSGHERTRSEIWGLSSSTSSPKKETSNDGGSERPRNVSARATASASTSFQKMLGSKPSTTALKAQDPWTIDLDKDDLIAEEEMKKLASKRKETEHAARKLDALRKRATPKEKVSPEQAIHSAHLNIYERGEIVDYKEVYFCGTQTAAKHVGDLHTEAANFGYDDDRGDYSIVLGDHLSYRYEIVDILGKGSFGQVVRCVDHKTGGLVAIKIIRNKKRFHQQALVEVNILQKLREWDPQNKHSMVNFTQSFYFRGHLCISTELLDMNLYEFIKSNGFRGSSLKLVRRFTKQLLSSLLLLKQHKVIHCDLKPENILLAHPMHSEIKVIDFGSSCFENEKVYTYIQSRFYRSPEVILGMTYGMPIDMWSVGCILAELYTGYPIFPGENEQEQLSCIMEVFGPPEKHLIEKSTRKKLFFDSLGKPRLTVSSKGRRRKPSSKNLQQVLKCDDEAFLDFLARCLRWDPDRRLKPEDAMRHEFMTGQKAVMPIARAPTGRTNSPLKRYNTVTTPSASNRPLPEPPVTSLKNGAAVRSRDNGASPVKSAAPRRQSTVGAANLSVNKRTSGGSAAANSSLPRVTRSVSAKQDLASAGATVAMGRRA